MPMLVLAAKKDGKGRQTVVMIDNVCEIRGGFMAFHRSRMNIALFRVLVRSVDVCSAATDKW